VRTQRVVARTATKMGSNNLLVVLVLIAGIVFVYSAVKGKDPRDVLKEAIARGKEKKGDK